MNRRLLATGLASAFIARPLSAAPTLQSRLSALRDGDTLQLEPTEVLDQPATLYGRRGVTLRGPSRITGAGVLMVFACDDTTVRDIDFVEKTDTALTLWSGKRNRVENVRCLRCAYPQDNPVLNIWHQQGGQFLNLTWEDCVRGNMLLSVCQDCQIGNWLAVCQPGLCEGRMVKIQNSERITGNGLLVVGGRYTGLAIHQCKELALHGVIARNNGQEGIWFSGQGSERCVLTGAIAYGTGGSAYDIAIHPPLDRFNTVHAVRAGRVYAPDASNKVVL